MLRISLALVAIMAIVLAQYVDRGSAVLSEAVEVAHRQNAPAHADDDNVVTGSIRRNRDRNTDR